MPEQSQAPHVCEVLLPLRTVVASQPRSGAQDGVSEHCLSTTRGHPPTGDGTGCVCTDGLLVPGGRDFVEE